MVVWHDRLQLIDHGASLYVHHAWNDPDRVAASRFAMIREHVLLRFAGDIAAAGAELAGMIDARLIEELLAAIPDEWLATSTSPFADAAAHRAAYWRFLQLRLDGRAGFEAEADAARAALAGAGGAR